MTGSINDARRHAEDMINAQEFAVDMAGHLVESLQRFAEAAKNHETEESIKQEASTVVKDIDDYVAAIIKREALER